MKFRNPFRASLPAIQSEPEETVRNSIFSTGIDPSNSRVSVFRRQQIAMSRTFLRGTESLKPMLPDGTLSTAGDYAMDEAYPDLTQAKLVNSSAGYIPLAQLEWFANQGFIGWQMCALLSQNWLIDKVCGVPAQDVVRKGYDITLSDGTKLDPEIANEIRLRDKKMQVSAQLKTFVKKGRIFGIRHILFLIDGIDYEAPFNPDGIRPGSYKGMVQIDPYWMAPILDRAAAANPMSPEFYEPTWWQINGQKIHRSHFVIMRNGDAVVDLLKPAYLYGGIPIPQKIYERVYASERAANEAPLLLLSKRLTTFKTDTTGIFGPDSGFTKQMTQWAQWQNNFGVKVIGLEDEVNQFETSMGEVNETINTQFALVCSAGNCPVTKIMGTPPKGMDATGEYDEASYHEEIESIQEEIGSPLIERHHLCQMRSYIAPKFKIAPLDTEIQWKPLDSYTTEELATINKTKAETRKTYVDMGAVDGTDIRGVIISEPESGFNALDPIVPDGPGDREHEQEVAAKLLESSTTPKEPVQEKRDQVMDEWTEEDHPRDEDGKFAKSASEFKQSALKKDSDVHKHHAEEKQFYEKYYESDFTKYVELDDSESSEASNESIEAVEKQLGDKARDEDGDLTSEGEELFQEKYNEITDKKLAEKAEGEWEREIEKKYPDIKDFDDALKYAPGVVADKVADILKKEKIEFDLRPNKYKESFYINVPFKWIDDEGNEEENIKIRVSNHNRSGAYSKEHQDTGTETYNAAANINIQPHDNDKGLIKFFAFIEANKAKSGAAQDSVRDQINIASGNIPR